MRERVGSVNVLGNNKLTRDWIMMYTVVDGSCFVSNFTCIFDT